MYVIEGTPDAWLDGTLHRLRPGDAVGFPAGTGIAHSFLNTRNLDLKAKRKNWWDDAPQRPLGDHDGLSDKGSDP